MSRRAYVDAPVGDIEAATRVGERAARAWSLSDPVVLRIGMNAILRCGDVVLRVAVPTAPAEVSIALAHELRSRGISVAQPAHDGVFAEGEYAVTAWEYVESSGEPTDWSAVGEMVAAVHEIPTAALPAGLPLPSPCDLPWWEHDQLLDEVAEMIDDRALVGIRAAIDRHSDWDDFDGSDDNVLCHGDVHPGNVIMTSSGPVLIDWDLLCVGPRGWDHAPLMTWTERWGGAPGIYEAFAAGYGWSARDERYGEAFAELRLVSATLMRCRVALHHPPARAEALSRLEYWRGEQTAATWNAQ